MALTVSRKQRLRTLENRIRQNYESFVQTGQDLMEIRNDCLYEEAGFKTWTEYLRKRVGGEFGIESRQAQVLIMCAEIRPKLPTPPSRSALRDNGWTQREIIELRRLAPVSEDHDQRYDFRKLRKQDVQRVINRAAEIAENEGKPVSSTIIRRAVDEDLGTERKQKQKSEPVGIDLDAYLRRHIGTIEGVIENLAQVPAGGWTQLEKSDPGLAERLAEVCDELAALLRS